MYPQPRPYTGLRYILCQFLWSILSLTASKSESACENSHSYCRKPFVPAQTYKARWTERLETTTTQTLRTLVLPVKKAERSHSMGGSTQRNYRWRGNTSIGFLNFTKNEWMNERTNKRTNKRMKESTNERTNERTNEWKNQQMNE